MPKRISLPSPPVVFLILASVFGLAFLILTPPFQVPDEHIHFFRAYHVSEFKVAGKTLEGQLSGDVLPKSLGETAWGIMGEIPFHPEKKQDVDKILSAFKRPLNPKDRIFTDFRGALIYSPMAYLPQSIGILAVRVFGGPPILMLYAGRLLNLAVWIALIFLALRLTPAFHWVFIAVALMPQSLFQAASQSADVFAHALSFLLIAQILRIAYSPGIKHVRFGMLVLTAVLLTLTKSGYFLILGLLFIVPAAKFGGRMKRAAFTAALLALCFVITAGWAMVVRNTYIANHADPNIRPADQIREMVRSPLSFPLVLARSTFQQRDFLLRTFFGVLGWGDTPLPRYLMWILFSLLFAAALTGTWNDSLGPPGLETNPVITAANRIVFIAIVLLMYAFVAAVAYVYWTPFAAKQFWGVQGRYLIPFIPVFFFAFSLRRRHFARALSRLIPYACSVFAVFSLFVALRTMFLRYYG